MVILIAEKYFHTAWADSEDGDNFTLTEPTDGSFFIGTYISNSEEESSDPSRYSWKLVENHEKNEAENGDISEFYDGSDIIGRLENLEISAENTQNETERNMAYTSHGIGNENLLEDTNKGTIGWIGYNAAISQQESAIYDELVQQVTRITKTGASSRAMFSADEMIQYIEEGIGVYTLSFDYRISENKEIGVSLTNEDGSVNAIDFGRFAPETVEEVPLIGAWQHVELTGEMQEVENASGFFEIRFDLSALGNSQTFDIFNLKLEPGASATPWSTDAVKEALTASGLATEAQSTAQTAQESAESAQASANSAQASADNALAQANTAAGAAANALSQAETATQAANDAVGQANTAAQAASNALTQAQSAAGAAQTASQQAQSATQSATNAGIAASQAQSAAEAAQTAAGVADGKAQTAQDDINAQKAYFWHDDQGAHVLSESQGSRVDMQADGMHIRDLTDSRELAKFTREGVTIGKASKQRLILSDSTMQMKASDDTTPFDVTLYDESAGSRTYNEHIYLERPLQSSDDRVISIEYNQSTHVFDARIRAIKSPIDISIGFSGSQASISQYCTFNQHESVVSIHAVGTLPAMQIFEFIFKYSIDDPPIKVKLGNYPSDDDSVFCVGNGGYVSFDQSSDTAIRYSNALSVKQDGNVIPGKINGIANLIYPVGSIYMSVNNTSPETLFGGSWERIQDTFLYAEKPGDTTYGAGSTGGSKDAVVVSHNHPSHSGESYLETNGDALSRRSIKPGSGTAVSNVVTSPGEIKRHGSTPNAGESGAGKNMPPFLAVYMWKRTA